MNQWMRAMLPSAILVLTAGWFAACSQDEDISNTPPTEQNQIPITFGSDIDDAQPAQTRATPLGSLKNNFVFSGYKHFDAECKDVATRQTVFSAYEMNFDAALANTTTDNTSGWYYVGINNTHSTPSFVQTIKYWDHSATAYRFFAISGAYDDVKNIENGTKRQLSIYVDGQNEDDPAILPKDKTTPYVSQTLVVPNADFNKPVVLKFYKPFARVRFILVDEQGKAITAASPLAQYIDKTSFSFRPTATDRRVAYEGSLISTHELTGLTPKHKLEVDMTSGYTTYSNGITIPYEAAGANYAFVTDTEKERWWHVIPPATKYGTFTLSFLYNGKTRSAVVPAEYMDWQYAYAYTYVFKVNQEEVHFDPYLFTYTQWQSGYTGTTTW